MAKLILLIASIQVENERDLSIAVIFSQARRLSLTIEILAILTFMKKYLQLHDQLKNEYIKDEYIYLMGEYFESNS